jgi:imidazolonepropionase-like amidohydrolase
MELIEAARFLGREKDLSTTAVGMFADLVLLDANRLEDIRNTSKIDTVILGRRLYDRTELNALLARAEEAANVAATPVR